MNVVFDDPVEPCTRLQVWLLAAVLILGVLVAALIENREAAARCAAGVDVEASCRGVARWSR